MSQENDNQLNNMTVMNTYGRDTAGLYNRAQNDATVMNTYGQRNATGEGTALNREADRAPAYFGGISLKAGDIVPGEFEIIRRIGSAGGSGEADLYLAKAGNPAILYNALSMQEDGNPASLNSDGRTKQFVVKIYNRRVDEKAALSEKLKKTNSPRIARVYYSGELFDRYFEVYEYYEKGSLADSVRERTFTFEELEQVIIPELNEALHDLHECGILHRDIKPNNIMWSNDIANSLVLIDFGLSSVARESKSIVVSTIGFTASYAAPEVLRNVYFDESDYYSFGILLYEMFTGKTPFGEDNSYTSIIAKPGNMPDRLYRLILGLTYQDLSFRNDPSNPNRRWTYEDVKKWLSGEEMPVPGYGARDRVEDENARDIPAFSFCGKEYTDIDSLCLAVGYHWEEGKSRILFDEERGLSAHLRDGMFATKRQRYFASVIDDVKNNTKYSADVKLAKILYTLSPDLNVILCPMGVFEDIPSFAESAFTALSGQALHIIRGAVDCVETVLQSGALTQIGEKKNASKEVLSLISEFEKRASGKDWFRYRERNTYELIYRLSGHKELNPGLPDGTIFKDLDSLKDYLASNTGEGYSETYRIVSFLLDSEHRLKPAVYGWLKSRGYELKGFE